jgi:2-hydroxy-6-oxonona-2,4-dienedioate hydrolase
MERSFKPFYHQAYLDVGSGSPLVILNGPFGNLHMWKRIIPALKEGYRIVVPRLPLFGLPAKSTSIKNLVEILNEFLEWHQLTDVTLLGHGLGGQIALRYAYDFPEVTRNVVISGTSNLTLNSLLDKVEMDQGYDGITQLIKKAFYDEKRVTHTIVDWVYEAIYDSSNRSSISKLMENTEDNNVNTYLTRIHQPVLLAWGLHDKITPPEIALHYHDHLPNAELKFIRESGHLPMVEQSEQFNAYLLDFLAHYNF